MRLVIDQATKTYEGVRVTVNVAVDLSSQAAGMDDLTEFFTRSWTSVVGSGLDTAILVNAKGEVVKVMNLEAEGDVVTSPERMRRLASWTAAPGLVGLAATRSGEIYVFTNSSALFVYRNAQWRGFTIDGIQRLRWYGGGTILLTTKDTALASLLDASAAHHGACLGIVRSPAKAAVAALVDETDRWDHDDNLRRRVLNFERFDELSRRQRLEMLSMDGATLLDRNGNILAAGAILKIKGGSTGGGRTAAAQAISHYGVGIKVSQDGPITAFADGVATPKFTMA